MARIKYYKLYNRIQSNKSNCHSFKILPLTFGIGCTYNSNSTYTWINSDPAIKIIDNNDI